jgi:hypothetical protein
MNDDARKKSTFLSITDNLVESKIGNADEKQSIC